MKQLILAALLMPALAATSYAAEPSPRDTTERERPAANGDRDHELFPNDNSSERANPDYHEDYRTSCFGEWRSWYANMLAGSDRPNGYYISRRAGDNPEIDRYFIEMNCSR